MCSTGAQAKEEPRAEDRDLARWRPFRWQHSGQPRLACCWYADSRHASDRDPCWLKRVVHYEVVLLEQERASLPTAQKAIHQLESRDALLSKHTYDTVRRTATSLR